MFCWQALTQRPNQESPNESGSFVCGGPPARSHWTAGPWQSLALASQPGEAPPRNTYPEVPPLPLTQAQQCGIMGCCQLRASTGTENLDGLRPKSNWPRGYRDLCLGLQSSWCYLGPVSLSAGIACNMYTVKVRPQRQDRRDRQNGLDPCNRPQLSSSKLSPAARRLITELTTLEPLLARWRVEPEDALLKAPPPDHKLRRLAARYATESAISDHVAQLPNMTGQASLGDWTVSHWILHLPGSHTRRPQPARASKNKQEVQYSIARQRCCRAAHPPRDTPTSRAGRSCS